MPLEWLRGDGLRSGSPLPPVSASSASGGVFVFVACWSVKGGSGTTVVAAALGVILARSSEGGALLVDLAGDLPTVLGLPEPDGPGLTEWFAAGTSVPADALRRLEVPVGEGLGLLPRGRGRLGPTPRVSGFVESLNDQQRSVVIDCGTLGFRGSEPTADDVDVAVERAVVEGVADRLLVTRPCYLSLRRMVGCPVQPTGVVLVTETGRSLGRRDVEQVVGVKVVAEVPIDPAVARCVDAGLMAGRLPPALSRALGRAI